MPRVLEGRPDLGAVDVGAVVAREVGGGEGAEGLDGAGGRLCRCCGAVGVGSRVVGVDGDVGMMVVVMMVGVGAGVGGGGPAWLEDGTVGNGEGGVGVIGAGKRGARGGLGVVALLDDHGLVARVGREDVIGGTALRVLLRGGGGEERGEGGPSVAAFGAEGFLLWLCKWMERVSFTGAGNGGAWIGRVGDTRTVGGPPLLPSLSSP